MKKCFLLFCLLISASCASGQIDFVGFDQPVCASPLSFTYTYSSYSTTGGSSALHGYKIFKDGIEVHYNPGGSMGLSQSVINMLFINDSTGFIVVQIGGMQSRLRKTSDYGSTWVEMPQFNPPGHKDFYPMNEHFAYLLSIIGDQVYVAKCSDVVGTPIDFIRDDTMTVDIYKTDTIYGNTLCGNDSLKIFIQNSAGDTITYHINIFSYPASSLGMEDHSLKSSSFTSYPNPAQGLISIDAEFSLAEFYSADGKKVLQSPSKTVDISALPAGIYFICISGNASHPRFSKFIKE